ncbi:hypothetical protein BLA29_015278, partial [Euroglyphus maynei]
MLEKVLDKVLYKNTDHYSYYRFVELICPDKDDEEEDEEEEDEEEDGGGGDELQSKQKAEELKHCSITT